MSKRVIDAGFMGDIIKEWKNDAHVETHYQHRQSERSIAQKSVSISTESDQKDLNMFWLKRTQPPLRRGLFLGIKELKEAILNIGKETIVQKTHFMIGLNANLGNQVFVNYVALQNQNVFNGQTKQKNIYEMLMIGNAFV